MVPRDCQTYRYSDDIAAVYSKADARKSRLYDRSWPTATYRDWQQPTEAV
jgi:hypothetical protein